MFWKSVKFYQPNLSALPHLPFLWLVYKKWYFTDFGKLLVILVKRNILFLCSGRQSIQIFILSTKLPRSLLSQKTFQFHSGYRKSTKDKREKAKEAKAAHTASQNTPISPNTGSDMQAPPSNLTSTSGANGDSIEEETPMAE